MPRTKKQRRERKRLARMRDRAPHSVPSLTTELDAIEFSAVFRLQGGRQHLLGMGTVASYDCNGKRVAQGIIPNILGIGRDKASKLMQKAKEAQLIQARKEALRVKRGNRQTRDILEAFDSGDLRWVRRDDDLATARISLPNGEQFVTGQQLKSYLVGSSDLNEQPLNRAVNQVVCFRGDDMRFYVGEETYDENSEATFVPLHESDEEGNMVTLITFPSRETAERTTLLRIEQGEVERLNDRIVGDIHARMDRKLRVWETATEDAEGNLHPVEGYEEFTPEVRVSDQYQRVSPPVKYLSDRETGEIKIAARVRPQDGADLQVTAHVSAKRSLRIDPLAESQLSQNRADS